jgi:antitoxin HicB
MQFPLVLTPDDDGTFMVTCPLLPEVTSFGEDHDDALTHGRDAVEEAIAARMARWEDIACRNVKTWYRRAERNAPSGFR